MAENEKDLHARLCVVEATVDRHCEEIGEVREDIGEVRDKVASLEICVSCLPDIKDSLKSIQGELKTLVVSTKGKSMAFLTIREWAILVIAAGGFILNHFMFK